MSGSVWVVSYALLWVTVLVLSAGPSGQTPVQRPDGRWTSRSSGAVHS